MADLNDIQLSTQDILKKQFRTKVKGIDPDEVDAFLDIVIADYDTFEQLIEDLYGQIGKLQGQLMADQQKEKQKDQFSKETNQTKATDEVVRTYTPNHSRNSSFTSISDSEANQTESSTNMAIIQRISALERKVYNLERQVYGLQKQ
ncbi:MULTISPECIES: DivIVA domain-containing protein [unclassified Lactobacillus]|uniref:DivIVA domain-containing protein n=1 Tax=unclassified Lactobacillus TaxID=2620435 RepID=UPI000EFD2A22|nr:MULTISPECIES: DivIVA domain-containing protein [unclassified Lactobacillus]RMC39954.1 DivIVA domain-containing protein [Lactobacillus sp. ESL0237]RMC44113.1 DivIVA domain-containing protein [Lactobacillus sp. ESL0234]RMC45442.1 DivIVA domain-containing protein [Lactobacillus sp. ESL0236]RMC46405.1 DivIVA domain-containing protein [Lactobacillus sp. ESL0230]RMC50707.1 DivIVA domain-containing protein [Lactobacillus sp. ESL0225]